MKLNVGLGALETYDALARSGADECFAGFVPLDWLEKYTNFTPLNRREVLLQGIQFSTMEEMRLLARKIDDTGVPVALTFNSISYLPEQLPQIANMLDALASLGFHDWILADPALLLHLKRIGLPGRIHLSGETGCFNPSALRFFAKLGIARCIFPRKITPAEMAVMIQSAPQLEYEAFILNERCHFSGAFCSSLHCDELDHLCRVPYRPYGKDFPASLRISAPDDAFGSGGCGLCALQALEQTGVQVLKVVGRGAHPENLIRDVHLLRAALDAPDRSPKALRALTGMEHCTRNCYYPEI